MESLAQPISPLSAAVERLSALAQTSRLNVFRLLVRAGHEGMRASDIADRLAIPANTLSTHLRILTDAELLSVKAASRERVYAVRFDAMRTLIAYLLEDCCQGSPEICAPLAELLAQPACCSPKEMTP
jgi:DNA-binding transcriptional ArsR family regulator